MNRLYIFNPGHEEALAHSGASSYTPKREVQQMMSDLAHLMLLLADPEDYVAILDRNGSLNIVNHQGQPVEIKHLPPLHLTPWAIEEHLHRAITQKAVSLGIRLTTPIVSREYLALSHRASATRLMNRFIERGWALKSISPQWVYASGSSILELRSLLERYSTQGYRRLMSKRPFTSSGRGVLPVDLPIEEAMFSSLCSQCRRSGGISLEPWLNIAQDWAIEYYYTPQEIKYIGLSYFQTKNNSGSYEGNLLATDEELQRLFVGHIGQKRWSELREIHCDFLRGELGENYTGYIGIDMCLYIDENRLHLNPAVEINVRCTMGVLAHQAFRKHIAHLSSNSQARYNLALKFYPKQGEALESYRTHLTTSASASPTIPLTIPSSESHFYAYLVSSCP